jgi:RimJ/RimL family protein N-acetyltransferase
MIRVAEKAGFVYEGVEREMVQWQGKWLDLIHFGVLRQEWEEI